MIAEEAEVPCRESGEIVAAADRFYPKGGALLAFVKAGHSPVAGPRSRVPTSCLMGNDGFSIEAVK